jgi:hypothetical protein
MGMPNWKPLVAAALMISAQGHAVPVDPLRSPECAAARAQLGDALDEPVSQRRAHPEQLARARKGVIERCLGHMTGNPQRTGAPDPPIAVPAPVVDAPRTAPPQLPGAAAPPALVTPRASVITACDPAGCWDSNGQRLNNLGPVLLGPHGVCVAQAGQVTCP